MRTATLVKRDVARAATPPLSGELGPGQLVSGTLDPNQFRAVVLARISVSGGATRSDLRKDIFALASHKLSPAQWRQMLDMTLGVLKADNLVVEKAGRIQATAAGLAANAEFLGGRGKQPADWSGIKDKRLMAKALGLENAPARKLSAIARPDGLRALVLQRVYGLKLKGAATPARVRLALAMVALDRAFGNQISGGLESGAGLSAKASRLLAGQLSHQQRDFGTDRRLIAALSAEAVGSIQSDHGALQTAILRKLLTGEPLVANVESRPVASPAKTRRKSSQAKSKNKSGRAGGNKTAAMAQTEAGTNGAARAGTPVSLPAGRSDAAKVKPNGVDEQQPLLQRPDIAGFSKEVQRQASLCAKGWPGDRKAFISHIWQLILERCPQWGLSAIEFKCMLTEAHQAGHILLAYADLKDKNNIMDVKASAIAYKNTVWHYVRVEE